MVVADVQVKSIRHKDDNGAVFRGTILKPDGTLTGEVITIALPGKIAGADFNIFKGQVFKVEGIDRKWRNPSTQQEERQINVKKLLEINSGGENFVAYVAGSKEFRGIGAVTAMALWRAYGHGLFEILKNSDVDSLVIVDGLTIEKAELIVDAWLAQNKAQVVSWLEMYNLPIWLGKKVVDFYTNESINKLNADPYRLIAFTVSWRKVDAIARDHFHISENDPRRLHAAVAEVLFSFYDYGDTAAESSNLIQSVAELVGAEFANDALRQEYVDGGFVRVSEDLFQSRSAFLQERFLSKMISERCLVDRQLEIFYMGSGGFDIEKILSESNLGFSLTVEQKDSVCMAITKPLSIITGGAGVGKTRVLKAIHVAVEAAGGQALQIALAGRAAKRMRDTTGRPAMTIAGFLINIKPEVLERTTHLIIDEASMLDLPLAVGVFKKAKKATITLVGDVALLSHVGPGKVFNVLAERKEVPTSRLTKIFRQTEESGIPVVSGSIRDGKWPEIKNYEGISQGVSFLQANSKNIEQILVDVYEELGGTDREKDVKILCATNSDAVWGTVGINRILSNRYTSCNDPILVSEGRRLPKDTGLRIGDLVVCTQDNWSRDIMNGSLGRIVRHANEDEIDRARVEGRSAPVMLVNFDIGDVLLDEDDIETIAWGYAITCHKGQGAKFRRVIISIVKDTLLDRSLIYTAITRAIEQVVLVGDEEVIKFAVENVEAIRARTIALDIHLDTAFAGGE